LHRYITIDRVKPAKSLPYPYSGDAKPRSLKQDVPKGRIHARITFPPPETNGQIQIKKLCFHSPFVTPMSVLVLAQDLPTFMIVLRMNDLAYCNRAPPIKNPLASLPMAVSRYGLSIDIRVTPGYQVAMYEDLVKAFRLIDGPYHKATVTGHGDDAKARFVVDRIQLSRRVSNGQLKRSKGQIPYLDAIRDILLLKNWGDRHLRRGNHADAYMCYVNALDLEKYWALHDPPTSTMTFWQEDSNTFLAVGTAIAVNMTIALVVGGLELSVERPRDESMHFWGSQLWEISGNGRWLRRKQYEELMFVDGLYHILTVEPLSIGRQLGRITNLWDTWPYKEDTIIPKLLAIVQSLQKELDAMPTDINAAQISIIIEHLADLRKLSRELKVEPIKWAVHERVLPKGLASLLFFLPTMRLVDGKALVTDGVSFTIPEFCEPTGEQLDSSEEGIRYVM
jgi:hypothetical protein